MCKNYVQTFLQNMYKNRCKMCKKKYMHNIGTKCVKNITKIFTKIFAKICTKCVQNKYKYT